MGRTVGAIVFPSFVRTGACGTNKMLRSHLSAADDVVAHKLALNRRFPYTTREQPPLLTKEGNTAPCNIAHLFHSPCDRAIFITTKIRAVADRAYNFAATIKNYGY